jgi:hypothetical protein
MSNTITNQTAMKRIKEELSWIIYQIMENEEYNVYEDDWAENVSSKVESLVNGSDASTNNLKEEAFSAGLNQEQWKQLTQDIYAEILKSFMEN